MTGASNQLREVRDLAPPREREETVGGSDDAARRVDALGEFLQRGLLGARVLVADVRRRRSPARTAKTWRTRVRTCP